MISHLKGTISFRSSDFLVVDVAGVGYKVFVTEETLDKVSAIGDSQVHIWTHLTVREDAHDLYGFLEKEELDFFELLITVSGIGPKTALAILNLTPVETLATAIASGDATLLSKSAGIGGKRAEKIIIELKDKFLTGVKEGDGGALRDQNDAIEALKSLGYSEKESRDALKKINKEIVGTGERVKQALKLLGK
ncbi:MAG: Holliday junction branch migration protein RuvA [Candidatus Taylorbacteria bacterium]